MNTQRVQMLRQAINEGQRALTAARGAIVADPCADDNDLATVHENISANIMLMLRAQQRLLRLEQGAAAIAIRLHNFCADCGEEIPPRRLEATPEAIRCAACQEDWEEDQRWRQDEALTGEYGFGFYNM